MSGLMYQENRALSWRMLVVQVCIGKYAIKLLKAVIMGLKPIDVDGRPRGLGLKILPRSSSSIIAEVIE